MARGTETEVRAYEGEVESLTSATSAGIGIRVVVDHRLGFAWAGSLDESVLAETLAEARDNARFATADEHVGLAVPDGVAGRRRSTCGTTGWPRCPRRGRSSWPWPSRPGPGPPTRGSARWTRPTTATWPSESALVSTTGIRSSTPQDVGLPVGRRHRRRGRRQPDRRRVTASAGASTGSTRTGRCDDAVDPGRPPARCHQGPVGPLDGGLRPAHGHHPAVDRVLGPVGRGGGQGPLVLRRPDRRAGRPPGPHPGRRPDRRPGLRRRGLRRRGPGLPAQRADRRRRAARLPLRHGVGLAGRGRPRPARPCAAASPARPDRAAGP